MYFIFPGGFFNFVFTVFPKVLHIILPLLGNSAHFDESDIIGIEIMEIY